MKKIKPNKFVVVIRAVIKKENKYLVVKQKNKGRLSYYMFPGGHLNPNETIFTGIKREVNEELKIKIIPQKILFINQTLSPFDNNLEIFIQCKLIGKINNNPVNNKSAQEKIISINFMSDLELKKVNFMPKNFLKNENEIGISFINLNLKKYFRRFGYDKNIKKIKKLNQYLT